MVCAVGTDSLRRASNCASCSSFCGDRLAIRSEISLMTAFGPKSKFLGTAPETKYGRKGHSAKGAKYESQGQGPSAARHVAPGSKQKSEVSTESATYRRSYFALSELHGIVIVIQGRRASRCSALAPGFHISRLWRSPSILHCVQDHS